MSILEIYYRHYGNVTKKILKVIGLVTMWVQQLRIEF